MFKHYIEKLLIANNIDPSLLEIPQDRSLGDFAFPCFSFAKEWRKAPAQIATELATKLDPLANMSVPEMVAANADPDVMF